MTCKKQHGFFNLSNLILLAIVAAGIGFMYFKGYRLQVETKTSAGDAASGQPAGFYYTVQVSVTPNESKAINLVNDLERDGYDAYYDTYQLDNGARQYKVRVGQYDDQQTATAVKTQMRQRYERFRDSFVNLIND